MATAPYISPIVVIDFRPPADMEANEAEARKWHEATMAMMKGCDAAALREARSLLGLTQQALADKLHMTRPSISMMESGKMSVQWTTAVCVAYFLREKGLAADETLMSELRRITNPVKAVRDREPA